MPTKARNNVSNNSNEYPLAMVECSTINGAIDIPRVAKAPDFPCTMVRHKTKIRGMDANPLKKAGNLIDAGEEPINKVEALTKSVCNTWLLGALYKKRKGRLLFMLFKKFADSSYLIG